MWKMIHRNYRRLVAFMLTVAMVITNAGMNLTVAFAAGENENALFLVEGAELKAAIREAEKEGEVFKFSSLELKAGKKSVKNRYEKLLGAKDGKVYQLDLDIDDSFAGEDTSLEVFYNAGTDNVIFLFINESDMVVSFRVNIDGYETEPVTVNPNTVNVEDDENPSYAENYEAGDMIDDVQKKLGAEVLNPQETPAEEETSESESVPDENKPEEVLPPEETPSPEETMPPEETETTENGSGETDPGMTDESQAGAQESEPVEEETVAEETEAETEAPETEAPETQAENGEEEAVQENDPKAEADSDIEEIDNQGEAVAKAEALLNVSHHETAVVAVSAEILEDGDDADSAADEIALQEEENEAEETEAEETEAEPADEETAGADAEETAGESEDKTEESQPETAGTEEETSADETEAETKADESQAAGIEAETKDETLPSEETGADETEGETSGGSSIGEANEGEPGEIIGNGKNEEPSAAPDDSIADDENVPDSGNNGNDSLMEEDGQLLEDDSIELLGKLKGKEYNTVTIRDHANAKALRVEWKDIQEIINSSVYMVDYVAEPFDAASVKGADSVAEGENLYFAVEPENGYEILRVTANGEELDEIEDRAELASGSNWKGYPHVYAVKEATEDLLIDIEMEELVPVIAASVYTAKTDDAIFMVNVPDGAFMEEVELKVEKITEEETVNELTSQAVTALKEGQIVAGVLAYDVAFVSKDSGNEVEPMEAVEVSIRYKEAAVPEEIDKKAVTEISVVHLPENEDAEVVTSIEDVEETEFVFRADSFSPVVVVYAAEGSVTVNGKPYSTLKDAINSIEGGGSEDILVQLQADARVDYLNPVGKSFTLDLNGHTVYGTTTYYVLYVSADITIMDSSEEKNGAISHEEGVDGGGVYVNEQGIFTMNGGKISGNKATNGGGVYVDKNGVFIMNGGEISGNKATSGGGVYMYWNDEFTMNGGIISENSAENGGGVYLYWSGTKFTINSNTATISNNTASGCGGGVYIYYKGNFTMSGGKIEKNINGGIYANDSENLQLSKVAFTENTGNQPVLYVGGKGQFDAKECEFLRNTGNSVLYISGQGSKTLTDCTISNNEINGKDYLGGNIIYLDGSAEVSFTECKINDNSAKADNGNTATVCVGAAKTVNMNNTQIVGNQAAGKSGVGGIRQRGGQSSVTLENTVITRNAAIDGDECTGGVYVQFGTFKLLSGAVYNNLSYNNELRDFCFVKDRNDRTHWELIKASTMKNSFEEENYFDEEHDNYAWFAGLRGEEARTLFDNGISDKDTTVKEIQVKDYNRPLCLQAIPRKEEEGVYISGLGADNNDGTTPEQAVSTLEKALDLLEKFNEGKEEGEKSNTIYVTGNITGKEPYAGTIIIKEDISWDGKGITLKRDPSGRFKGVMVDVQKGKLELKNITLDGGAEKGIPSNGLVRVQKGGELIIDEDAVLQNSIKNLGNKFEGGGGVYSKGGNVTLNKGGKIVRNSSHNGGGISLMDDSKFIMNGGEISDNTTDRNKNFSYGSAGQYTSGGGVFIAYSSEMEMNGGTISGNTSYDGGGISLGGPENDVFYKNSHPIFTMNGGTIEGNQVYSAGGGIYVQMNCEATINGGNITNNHTQALGFSPNFGGGGIYVNGGKGGYTNGVLKLFRVEITENESKSDKGGATIAGCPTSNTKIYLTDGGVIHENKGMNDIYLSSIMLLSGYGTYSGTAQLIISPYMLGGGAYHWRDNEGNELPLNDGFVQISGEEFYAKTLEAGDALTGLDGDNIKTRITGNTSDNCGAAIGSNGDVIIGREPQATVELTVEKNWNDDGYADQRPEHVDIRILQSTDGENFTDIGFVRLYKEKDWEKVTLKDLPKQNEEGTEFIYKVAEVPNGYDSEAVTVKEGDSFVAAVTNTPTYALTLKKEVEGPAASDTFGFAITLSQKDGSLFTGEVDVIGADGNQSKLSFENGKAAVSLGAGESLQLKNLQPGMRYTVEETDNGGAKDTRIMIDEEPADAAQGEIRLGGNINVVTFTNTFEEEKPETGILTVRKMVEGTAGETERDFRFQVILNDDSINGEFSGLKFEKGVSEEFALRHGQVRTISDLPAGIGYMVEELGAQELQGEQYEISFKEDGKDTVVTEARITGTVGAGETVNVICTNKKDKPDEPDTPDRPNRPGGGGGTPSGPRGGGNTPGGPGTTTIDEPGVPLANLPGEPVTEMIEEQEVPLSALPKTGDSRHNGMLMMMFGMAGLGMLLAAAGLKKRKDESDQ